MPISKNVAQETYSGVTDALSHPHFLLQLDGTVVLANKAAKQQFCISEEQLDSVRIQDLVVDEPDKIAQALKLWARNASPVITKLTFKEQRGIVPIFICKGNAIRLLNHQTRAFLMLQCQEKSKVTAVFMSLNKRIEQLEYEKRFQFNEREKAERLNQELELRVKERTEDLEKAYAQLRKSLDEFQQAQEQLVRTERLASLGNLVAGVAHEINTPIGVCVTASTYLQNQVQRFKEGYSHGRLKRVDFESYLDASSESSTLIHTNLERAAGLIESFKQLAVDQTSDQKREVNLQQFFTELLTSLGPYFKHSSHQYSLECEDDIEIDTFPGAIGQIVTNLISNSIVHGFEGITQGRIFIKVSRQDQHILIHYSDNGVGITDEVAERIFEPFYTTKRNKGGSGLGMNIIYNLVKDKLDGNINLTSKANQGFGLEILLPLSIKSKTAKLTAKPAT